MPREKDKEEYKFFIAQLSLFAKLCFRRHKRNIELLTGRGLVTVDMVRFRFGLRFFFSHSPWMSGFSHLLCLHVCVAALIYPQIMETMRSSMVPKALRSAFVDVLTNWFIDVEPNRTTLDNPRVR